MKWIIVLGMHRSGTSAITKAVSTLGASLGNETHVKKHWENIPLRNIGEELLTLGDGSWDAPPPREWLDDDAVQALVPKAQRIVAREFGDADVAIWKDPRTCVTLPFWLQALPGEHAFLVIHRHPTEVAASLTSRNHFGPALGYALWERYNADLLAAISGRPAVVLDYATVLDDPVAALTLVRTSFATAGVELPNDPATTDHGLVSKERHHTADADSLHEVATASQRELFATLRRLEGAHDALPVPAHPPVPNPLSVELLELAGKLRRSQRARKQARRQDADGDDAPGRGAGRGQRRAGANRRRGGGTETEPSEE